MATVPQCTLVNEWHHIFVIASFASRLFVPVQGGPRHRVRLEYGSTSGILRFYTGRTFTRQYNLSCR